MPNPIPIISVTIAVTASQAGTRLPVIQWTAGKLITARNTEIRNGSKIGCAARRPATTITSEAQVKRSRDARLGWPLLG